MLNSKKIQAAIEREDYNTINRELAGSGYQVRNRKSDVIVENEDGVALFRSRSLEAAMTRIHCLLFSVADQVASKSPVAAGVTIGGENQPSLSALDKLVDLKEEAYTRLKAKSRELKDIELEVAGIESRLATYLITAGEHENAVLNLVSEASLLVNADEYLEAIEVYKKALEIANKPATIKYLREAVAAIEKRVENLKIEKPLAPVIDLVVGMGARLSRTADGVKGGPRWLEFGYKDVEFRCDIGTTYVLTSSFDPGGIEVTSLDRLQARIDETVDKIGVREQAESDMEEDDYGDDDLDE